MLLQMTTRMILNVKSHLDSYFILFLVLFVCFLEHTIKQEFNDFL